MEGRGMKTWRIFMRQDTRRICNFLIILCLILFICIISRIKAHYCPAAYGKLVAPQKVEMASKAQVKQLTEQSRDNSIEDLFAEDEDDEENSAIYPHNPICHESNKRSDTCDARGDLRVQGSSNTIFVSSTKQEWKIKPYARKGDIGALSHVSEWSLKPFEPSNNNQQIPNCTVKQRVPAVIFSVNGYTGNIFHDFTDILIPLFISSHQFNGEVQFLVTDTKPWWVNKYKLILKHLSSYQVIDLHSDGEMVRCFPRVIIGLQFHKELGIDSTKSPTGYSIVDFRVLLRKAYGLERADTLSSVFQGSVRRPRLLIISRKRSRSFVNEKGMTDMAMSLGFDVRIAEAEASTDVSKFARLVNSADVLVGVHGAGLTNMVFLPAGAVVIQVVPFGGLEWLARETFRKPINDLELNYLEYRIQVEESTLIDQYPRDHPVLRDPTSVSKLGWNALKEVYLDKQNVRPHLGRLKDTFLKALKLLPKKQ